MEHLDVLVVGAGLSGIGAGHYLQTECPWASYAIFEAPRRASAARGTCSATPASAPTPTCTRSATRSGRGPARRAIADGASILRYIEDTAADEGIDAKIRFHHRIVARRLVDRRGPLARHRRAHRHRRDRRRSPARFLFSCTGYYRYDHGYQPDFAGHRPASPAASCTRRPGPTTSTTPAGASS